jgi:hypothetical protein
MARRVAAAATAVIMTVVNLRLLMHSSPSSFPSISLPSSTVIAYSPLFVTASAHVPTHRASSSSTVMPPRSLDRRHLATIATWTTPSFRSHSSSFVSHHHRTLSPRGVRRRLAHTARGGGRGHASTTGSDDDDCGGCYRASAESLSTSPSSSSFGGGAPSFLLPSCWTHARRLANDDDDGTHRRGIGEHLRFDKHVCHVVVPEYDDGTNFTCEDVVRWVVDAASSSSSSSSCPIDYDSSAPSRHDYEKDHGGQTRRFRIYAEWNEGGEEMSSSSSSSSLAHLDPAYRHDPSLLPRERTTTNPPDDGIDDGTDGPYLIASELLALGSVWRLPYDAHRSKSIDRFDPRSGIKPTRLDVGDALETARPGDYFRVHFDPRRYAPSFNHVFSSVVRFVPWVVLFCRLMWLARSSLLSRRAFFHS